MTGAIRVARKGVGSRVEVLHFFNFACSGFEEEDEVLLMEQVDMGTAFFEACGGLAFPEGQKQQSRN